MHKKLYLSYYLLYHLYAELATGNYVRAKALYYNPGTVCEGLV